MSKEIDIRVEVKKSRESNDHDRPREYKVEIKKTRRHTTGPIELRIDDGNVPKISTMSQNYAYVNAAYVGSTNSVNHVPLPQTRIQLEPPIDTVYREQYCVCARWPLAKKAIAIAVGLLFGAAVGLTISMTLGKDNGIDFPLLRSRPD